mmetsp:Transcript_3911/g.4880  ORF Transcript_3911/g.4880 Transcript_3911/m.4880 type:complete len:104 (-) Transcript_3911:1377-1688(-)
MLFGHRQMLISELKNSKTKSKILTNAILLVLLQGTGCALPLPIDEEGMTRVLRLIPVLKSILSEDRALHFINACQTDVQDNDIDILIDLVRETAEAKDPTSLS